MATINKRGTIQEKSTKKTGKSTAKFSLKTGRRKAATDKGDGADQPSKFAGVNKTVNTRTRKNARSSINETTEVKRGFAARILSVTKEKGESLHHSEKTAKDEFNKHHERWRKMFKVPKEAIMSLSEENKISLLTIVMTSGFDSTFSSALKEEKEFLKPYSKMNPADLWNEISHLRKQMHTL